MKQIYNPYLPNFEYIPDAEPHVFGDRVYIYGSHDRFDGNDFCMNDYVTYSAPINNLKEWKYEGVLFSRFITPNCKKNTRLYAPDCAKGVDGNYYLYYFSNQDNRIHVCKSSSPAGPFEYYGSVHYDNGIEIGTRKGELRQFDPGVFVDDDGRVYLYLGFGPLHYPKFMMAGHGSTCDKGAFCYELEPDMLTVKEGPKFIGVIGKKNSKGTAYEGHEFFEASSMRKINGKYYFIYSSFLGHELAYAISDYPDRDFKFGGVLVSIGDVGLTAKGTKDAKNYTGNTHGSILQIDNDYYVFYHRQTNLKQFSRQACAEKIEMDENGLFKQAEVTSCGLNGGPLFGRGTYPASIACNLMSRKGTRFYWVLKLKMLKRAHPYFTQKGGDREDTENQYIANVNNGTIIGYKYFDFNGLEEIEVNISKKVKGKFIISISEDFEKDKIGEIDLHKTTIGKTEKINGVHPLFFKYIGPDHFDFIDFTLF